MVFVRTKMIKGKKYAYLVENKWKRGRSKQKVKAYLGKVVRPERDSALDFEAFISRKGLRQQEYLDRARRADIVRDLVEWELERHGIKEFSIDLRRKCLVVQNIEKIALEINEGFMCGATIGSILTINPDCDREALAFQLASAFVDAGIQIPKDVFVAYFAKTNYLNT